MYTLTPWHVRAGITCIQTPSSHSRSFQCQQAIVKQRKTNRPYRGPWWRGRGRSPQRWRRWGWWRWRRRRRHRHKSQCWCLSLMNGPRRIVSDLQKRKGSFSTQSPLNTVDAGLVDTSLPSLVHLTMHSDTERLPGGWPGLHAHKEKSG